MKNLITNFGKFKSINEQSDVFLIEDINKEDIKEIIDICIEAFSSVDSPEGIAQYTEKVTNWDISKKATLNGEIIGIYLFNEENINQFGSFAIEDLSKYRNLRGIQGVALVVKPEYRGGGYGRKLRDVPLSMGYDYIWGQHLKGLHNVDEWVRFGRRVIADTGGMYITLMDIRPMNESIDKHHKYQEDGYTCGPTCVKIVTDFLGIDKTMVELIDLCNCTPTSGTIDTGIKNALDKLGIKNKQNPHMGNLSMSMSMLNTTLLYNNIFIMRTLTRSIKHWIVVYGKSGDEYLVADPWLGLIKYNKDSIISIWEPRNFDGFVVYK